MQNRERHQKSCGDIFRFWTSVAFIVLLMNFQVMSDLHLETPFARPTYDDFAAKITPRSPYLALPGDIGYACDSRLFDFLQSQLHHFQIVFFLLGNHEPYGTSFSATKALVEAFAAQVDAIRRESKDIGRFIFLDQTRYDIDQRVNVLGCTLFSRISGEQAETVKMFVTDFSRIENWEIHNHNQAHQSDLSWLNTQIKSISEKEPERTVVVFTHHSPTMVEAATDPRHKNDSAQVASGFATDLSEEICWCSTQVKLWAFGHTHFNCDFEDPHTNKRVVANQKGYRRTESFTFDVMKTVQIDTFVPSARKERREKAVERMGRSRLPHRDRRREGPNDKRSNCMTM